MAGYSVRMTDAIGGVSNGAYSQSAGAGVSRLLKESSLSCLRSLVQCVRQVRQVRQARGAGSQRVVMAASEKYGE